MSDGSAITQLMFIPEIAVLTKKNNFPPLGGAQKKYW